MLCQGNFSTERYKAISFDKICGYPNIVPPKIRDRIPKFNGEKAESISKHFQEFVDMMGDYELDFEDVVMKLFVQSLKGDARDWFSYLPASSIHSLEDFRAMFMEKFGERIDPILIRKRFMSMKKQEDELVPSFNLRFSKIIRKIFERIIPYLLRDKEPITTSASHPSTCHANTTSG